MNVPTRHPLVQSYLGELERLLATLDPDDRAEVTDGVREHVDAALAPDARDDQVRAVLAGLGSPSEVAAAAYGERGVTPVFLAPRPFTSRAWVPGTVAVLLGLAVLVALLVAGTVVAVGESSSTTSAAGSAPVTVTQKDFNGSFAAIPAILFATAPFWLIALVSVNASALWTGREKFALSALVPVVALLFGLLPEIGYAAFGITGVYVGGWTALTLTVVGSAVLLWTCTKRAGQRVH